MNEEMININYKLDKEILDDTNITIEEIYKNASEGVLKCLIKNNANVLNFSQLDGLINRIIDKLYDFDISVLYKTVIYLRYSSIDEFKEIVNSFIENIYEYEFANDYLTDFLYTIEISMELYRPIIINAILNDQDILMSIGKYSIGQDIIDKDSISTYKKVIEDELICHSGLL